MSEAVGLPRVEAAGEEPTAFKYSAFISYNNHDRRWASWLHRQLETYQVPARLVGATTAMGPVTRRLKPAFQDREDLASTSDLGADLRRALSDASALVVICSPEGARSRWVNEEIRTFAALGKADRIFCLIVGGRAFASRRADLDAALECFPPALLEIQSEPLAADVREGGDGKASARLKLLAGVIGVGYDELRQRDAARRQRQMLAITAASLAGVVMTSTLAVAAVLARDEAVRQRQTAERTVEFVKSLFAVSDPSEAKGATITAREVLDRGARQIDAGLADEPSVKTELSVTLGEVYLALGLYREGERLIRRSLSIQGVDRAADVRRQAALGSAQTKQGDYAGAIKSYEQALAGARRAKDNGAVSAVLVGLSEAQSSNGDSADADRSASEALRLDEARLGPNSIEAARDLEAKALNAFFDERFAVAQAAFERARDIRVRQQGGRHPKVAEDLSMLGSVAYLRNDPATAERNYRQALAVYEVVLGPNHPDLAVTLNNLARVQLERRQFAQAGQALERSLAVTLRERNETHDDLAFTFANLGLVRRETGRAAEAETLLRKALVAARAHKHRNTAPVLTDLADVLCARGAYAEAAAMLDEARPLMAKTYPDDPWRVAWTDNTRAACLARQGRSGAAAALFQSSGPVLAARWPADSLYGHLARVRAQGAGASGDRAR